MRPLLKLIFALVVVFAAFYAAPGSVQADTRLDSYRANGVIAERFDDAGLACRATGALAKLMILDMQLVLDSYYGLRQRRALEKSEQLAAVGELAASIAEKRRQQNKRTLRNALGHRDGRAGII